MNTLTAGRELDALVAEKVMGLKVLGLHPCWDPECGDPQPCPYDAGVEHPVYLDHCSCDLDLETELVRVSGWTRFRVGETGHSYHCISRVPDYSTDIADAWRVIERMIREGQKFWQLDSLGFEGERWRVCFARGGDTDDVRQWIPAVADTAPHAICLAALKAVE